MERFYELGIFPDWWKLEPVLESGFWKRCGDIVRANDAQMQGIIVLGKEAKPEVLASVLKKSRALGERVCRWQDDLCWCCPGLAQWAG